MQKYDDIEFQRFEWLIHSFIHSSLIHLFNHPLVLRTHPSCIYSLVQPSNPHPSVYSTSRILSSTHSLIRYPFIYSFHSHVFCIRPSFDPVCIQPSLPPYPSVHSIFIHLFHIHSSVRSVSIHRSLYSSIHPSHSASVHPIPAASSFTNFLHFLPFLCLQNNTHIVNKILFWSHIYRRKEKNFYLLSLFFGL